MYSFLKNTKIDRVIGNSTVNGILAIGSHNHYGFGCTLVSYFYYYGHTLSLIYPLDSVSMSTDRGNSSKIGVMSGLDRE